MSCENVERMVILEAPGVTWDIETDSGVYYTLYIHIEPDSLGAYQILLETSMVFRRTKHDPTLKISYHDIALFAASKPVKSDTHLGTQYADSVVVVTQRDKETVFEIANRICSSKVPRRMYTPNDPGPYN